MQVFNRSSLVTTRHSEWFDFFVRRFNLIDAGPDGAGGGPLRSRAPRAASSSAPGESKLPFGKLDDAM